MVLIDGKPEYSCAREVATVAGKTVTTVEGLSGNGALHPAAAGVPRRAGRPVRLLPLRHFDLGGGAARTQSGAQAAPRSSRRSIRISAAAASTTASSAPCRRPAPPSRERGHDLQHAAAEPDRQSDPVAMDRVRGAGPRARRQRQGRDRPGHPDRAHADRRRGARPDGRAGAPGVRPDRHQPGRGLHLRQLFDRGRRRLDPPRLRRGALAVPRPPRRDAALPGGGAFDRGRQIPARRQGHRPRLLVDGGRDHARTPRQRHRADQAALDLSHRRQEPAAARPAGEGHRARRSSTTSRRRTSCTPACCASPGAARVSSRSTRARCARPPRRRSRFCARAISSPSRPRARSR